jgi:hypothetical protein
MSYPLSRPERVIVRFSPISDFSGGDGLFEDDSKQVPAWLAQRGLTQEVWQHWVSKLHSEVLPHGPLCGRCGYCLVTLFVPGCPFWFSKLGDYNDLLRHWTEEFNTLVLRPLNMFASMQSALFKYNRVEEYSKPFYKELSWLAIATTPEEVAELEKESHVWILDFDVRSLISLIHSFSAPVNLQLRIVEHMLKKESSSLNRLVFARFLGSV